MTRKEIDMLKHMLDKVFESMAEGDELTQISDNPEINSKLKKPKSIETECKFCHNMVIESKHECNGSDKTISISDGDKVYEFEKPDFECELLKVLYKNSKQPDILGIVNKNKIVTWFKSGDCYDNYESQADTYNLTPVKKI